LSIEQRIRHFSRSCNFLRPHPQRADNGIKPRAVRPLRGRPSDSKSIHPAPAKSSSQTGLKFDFRSLEWQTIEMRASNPGDRGNGILLILRDKTHSTSRNRRATNKNDARPEVGKNCRAIQRSGVRLGKIMRMIAMRAERSLRRANPDPFNSMRGSLFFGPC